MNEDEKIRKELIEHIKANQGADYVLFQKFSPDDVIAWLNKQKSVEEIVERCKKSWYNEGKIDGMAEGLTDEEKYQQGWHDAIEKKEEKVDNTNKVEQKFKAGDWVILTAGELSITLQIVSVDTNKKLYWFNDNTYLPIVDEECLHLWTIEDAKEGDVLYSLDSKQPFIFKHRKTNEQAEVYCGINIYGKFFVWGTKDCIITTDKYIPATKEQRDKLLKAMADAGYTFDFEKKELKKIEDESEDCKQQIMSEMADLIKDYIRQKPAEWGQEDEKNLKRTIWYVENPALNVVKGTMLSEWLKSLKDRVQPQKQWKPSEEQMDALEHFVRSIGESGYASPYDNDTKLIYSLLEQLKQL